MAIQFSERRSIKGALASRRARFSFLNLYTVYLYNTEPNFRKAIDDGANFKFVDGSAIGIFLSLRSLRRIRRVRGPSFARNFLSSQKYSRGKRYFFIGPAKEDLDKLARIFPNISRRNMRCHSPPFISGVEFSKQEVDKMARMINSFKADYVVMFIASPKQDILSARLFKKTRAKFFFNFGAAGDFILGRKKEAPKFFQATGMEWLYRLLTDFKYTWKKVWRSFAGILYLNSAQLRRE